MKLKRINESFDSPQFKISRYETDINDALKEFEDAYSQEKITAETYAKLLKDIYSVIENSDLDVKGLDESYERDVNLVAEMLKVSGLLSVEKLGENDWIEFDFGEERRFDTGRKFIQFEAIGETKRLKGRVEVTDDGGYDVKINYGSEAKCNSAVEIARFIAGEFGVVLNESLNEDTQLKLFDDDMIDDIEILYQWRPKEVEKILIKHGANPNNDTWTAGLDLPAAYDEIMSTFRDKYSDYDEIDYGVARVLGLVEESLNESNNAVYDMYKKQYKNLLQDIKYVLNSDNIEDIRAYDKEGQGEYILSKLFDSIMNKRNMSFEDAKEDVIDFLYRTRADAKSELKLRNKGSLESKSIMNKVKSELSKDYKLVSESENTLYFKAPDNSTHDDCIAFVDKVVAVSGGKYAFTGRGGSWTQWDILTPEGSHIKAGYDYSNKDNYAVYFKSILTESRRLKMIKIINESSNDSIKKYLIKKAQKVSSDLTEDAWISDQFVKSKGTRILLNIPIAKDIDSAHATEAEARAMKVYDTNDVWWDDFVLQVDVTNWFEDVKESLNEHRLNSLRQANVDAIEYFMEFEYIYHFPDGKFLATSWKDLKDGVVMGIDDDIEVAQGIMSYLQKEIDFNNKHKEIYDDDPQAELTLEVYTNVKRAYEKEISKYESLTEGIDGWDDRTGVIKRIDKYLSSNPEAVPPKGYIAKHTRAYDDIASRYGDYVTTPFTKITTRDLLDYARDNNIIGPPSSNILSTDEFLRKFHHLKSKNSPRSYVKWEKLVDIFNGQSLSLFNDWGTLIKDDVEIGNRYERLTDDGKENISKLLIKEAVDNSEIETRKQNYLKAKEDFETLGEKANNDVLSREEKMLIAKAEYEKVLGHPIDESLNEDYSDEEDKLFDKSKSIKE